MERRPEEGAMTVAPLSIVKPVVEALLEKVLVPEPEKVVVPKSVEAVSMVPARACVVPSKRIMAPLLVKLPLCV